MTCEYCQHADEEISILEHDLFAARDENHRLSAENAALRASGRLAPAVEGDVSNWIIGITAPAHHAFRMAVPNDEIIYSQYWAALDAAISAVLPIIVSATEARVREECAELAWVQAKQGATSDQIRNAIRTGAAR
jgi:hypothetical protein